MRFRKPKGPKKVVYQLIPRDSSDTARALYDLLDDLVAAHHDELIDARIALAWHLGWKRDVDGRITLGKCKKASDLDREFAPFDFVILLNRSFVLDPGVSEQQRKALLDHELSHATVKYEKDGSEPERDVRDRIVYRLRKHDIEEFAGVVDRHGLYKKDLESFAAAVRRAPQLPLETDGKAAKGSTKKTRSTPAPASAAADTARVN